MRSYGFTFWHLGRKAPHSGWLVRLTFGDFEPKTNALPLMSVLIKMTCQLLALSSQQNICPHRSRTLAVRYTSGLLALNSQRRGIPHADVLNYSIPAQSMRVANIQK